MGFKERYLLKESKNDQKYFDTIPCKGVKKKLGFSCGFDRRKKAKGKEYFVYTHRARSKGYESLEKIPLGILKFIDSTG